LTPLEKVKFMNYLTLSFVTWLAFSASFGQSKIPLAKQDKRYYSERIEMDNIAAELNRLLPEIKITIEEIPEEGVFTYRSMAGDSLISNLIYNYFDYKVICFINSKKIVTKTFRPNFKSNTLPYTINGRPKEETMETPRAEIDPYVVLKALFRKLSKEEISKIANNTRMVELQKYESQFL
jgi:hypothetical protein